MTSGSADVVIVGGAAMGSSLAYHLLSGGFTGRVVVVERDASYARSASALSAASIRRQFSTRVNIRASAYGVAFLREAGDRLESRGERPDLGFREGGYLTLATGSGAEMLARNHAAQTAEGADILLMDAGGLNARFPWLETGDLAAGCWGRSGEGWFDGWGLLQALRRKARALGAEYLDGEVAGFEREGARLTAVRLAEGTTIACGAVANCAGAAGGRRVAEMAGVSIPVRAKKRCVFAFSSKERPGGFPLLVDTSGVWVRPEGEGFICGLSPDDLNDEDHADDFDVDWPLFEERIWPALSHRVPAFEAIRPGRAWAGHYDMNLFDANAIVGSAGDPDNLYLCNGFSGHGLQQAPAVGRGLAELILHGRFTTLDLSDFAFSRIEAGRRLVERNVI